MGKFEQKPEDVSLREQVAPMESGSWAEGQRARAHKATSTSCLPGKLLLFASTASGGLKFDILSSGGP